MREIVSKDRDKFFKLFSISGHKGDCFRHFSAILRSLENFTVSSSTNNFLSTERFWHDSRQRKSTVHLLLINIPRNNCPPILYKIWSPTKDCFVFFIVFFCGCFECSRR